MGCVAYKTHNQEMDIAEMRETVRKIQTAVVTGPTGAIGIALCRCLIEAGVTVYAVTRPESLRARELPKNDKLYVIPCGLGQMETLEGRIVSSADVFFHLAWDGTIGKERNNTEFQLQNVKYTVQAVRAAEKLGCKVFIGAGSQAEYGRVNGVLKPDTPCFPETGYGIAKLCAGQMSRLECEKSGIDHIWIRILSVYGPHDGPMTMITRTIQTLLRGEKPKLTAGEQLWDYLYTTDAAEALYRAALFGRNRAIYPLGSGRAYPLRSYVETIRDAIDPSLELGFGEIPYGHRQVMWLQADLDALEHDTGFEPKMPFETGIRETIEWIRGRE